MGRGIEWGSKLARIKGGFKTSAKHQSSNQGTAATMRAFVVSSPYPRRFLVSPISRLLLLLFPPALLVTSSSSSRRCFFFFLFGPSFLSLSLCTFRGFLAGWWEREREKEREGRGEFAARSWSRSRSKPGSRVSSEGGRRENAGESKREGRVHREYCVRCQCTPW